MSFYVAIGIILAIILCAGVPSTFGQDAETTRDDVDVLRLRSSPDVDSGPLSALFDMANGFSHVAFADTEYILELVNKTIKTIDDRMIVFTAATVWEVLQGVGGFLFCVLFALLFLIILPIVGCCFCCCRCAGHCGGDMHQKRPETATKQRVFQCILTMVIVIIAAGCACMFGIFAYLNNVIPQIQLSADDVVDDIGNFAHKTRDDVQDLSTMMIRDITTTMDNALNVDDIEDRFSTRVMDVLNEDGRLDSINASVRSLQGDIDSTMTTINGLQVSVGKMKNDATQLMTDLQTSLSTIKSSLSACGTQECTDFASDSELNTLQTTTFDPDIIQVDVIDNIATDVAEIANENYPAQFQQAIDGLHDKIRNSSEEAVKAAKKEIDDVDIAGNIEYGTELVTDSLMEIENLRSQAHDVLKYFEYPQKYYNEFGKYVFVGIPAVLMLLWVVLPLTGLILGLFGGSPLKDPLKRGSASTAGGHILMSTVYLTFVFSWLFMLVTCLTFIPGTILENLGCRPLKDINMLTKIEAMAASHGASVYDMLPGNMPYLRNITVTGVLRNCEDGTDLFTALGLDQALDDMMTEYKDKYDVDSQIEKVTQSIDFDKIQVMPPHLEQALDDAKEKIKDFNYNTAKTEFASFNLSTFPDPDTFAVRLTELVDRLPDGTPGKAELTAQVANLVRVAQGVQELKQTQNAAIANVEQLSDGQATYTDKIDQLKTNLKALQTKVRADGEDMVDTVVRDFTDEIMSSVDSLTDDVKIKAQELFQCGCHVLTTLYHTVIDKVICGYVISPFNAFWFSMGQCVVFSLQILIFGTLLAKFYRRMRTSADDFDYPIEAWPHSQQMEMNDLNKMPLGYPVYPKDAPFMNSKPAYHAAPEG